MGDGNWFKTVWKFSSVKDRLEKFVSIINDDSLKDHLTSSILQRERKRERGIDRQSDRQTDPPLFTVLEVKKNINWILY